MAGHVAWRIRSALAVWAAGLLLAPALVSTYEPQQTQTQTQAAGQDPQVQIRLVSRLGGPGRAPRRLADLTMPVPADNPITDEKVALGRTLFFDTILSADRSIACVTCHDPDRAFADQRTLAVGILGRVGKRHSPALINRGFGRSHFWDGRAGTLEAQVLQPIADPNEMDLAVDDAVARLIGDATYARAFTGVFGAGPSADTLGRALATYLRSIRSGGSPYDRFIDGDTTALTAEQMHGLEVFRRRARCSICHAEPLFSDEAFQNTGVAWQVDAGTGAGAFQDDGRFAVTKLERDRGKFKTPTLREIARTAPYMHDGSLATLEDVVDFYDRGGRPNVNIFPVIRPLGLTPADKQALVKFLEALSGVVTK